MTPYLKSQLNLERHLALHQDLAHRDIDVELAKATHMAQVMDTVLERLAQRTTDTCCQRCGRRIVLAGPVDPLDCWVCADCVTPDRPESC